MRYLALLVLLVLPALPSDPPDVETFYHRLLKLDEAHEIMIHDICGWPEKLVDVTPPPCNAGPPDAKKYKAAREAAKKFYGLAEPK